MLHNRLLMLTVIRPVVLRAPYSVFVDCYTFESCAEARTRPAAGPLTPCAAAAVPSDPEKPVNLGAHYHEYKPPAALSRTHRSTPTAAGRTRLSIRLFKFLLLMRETDCFPSVWPNPLSTRLGLTRRGHYITFEAS